jgi:hypothetical protein
LQAGVDRAMNASTGGFEEGRRTFSPVNGATASTAPGRVLAVLLAVAWGIFGFGIIDLETAIPPENPEFRGRWFLEGSNGLYLTALVIVPLLVVAMTPSQLGAVCRQLHVVAGCTAVAALLCLDPLLVVRILQLELTALLGRLPLREASGGEPGRARWWTLIGIVVTFFGLPMLFGADSYDPSLLSLLAGVIGLAVWLAFAPAAGTTLGRFPVRPSRSTWAMFLVAALGTVLWLSYSVRVASDYWSGLRYPGFVDVISGQAGLAIALAALPLGVALGWLPVRLPMWTGATLGAGVGCFAILNPDEIVSFGGGWGVVAIVWSGAALLVSEATLQRLLHAGRRRPDGEPAPPTPSSRG